MIRTARVLTTLVMALALAGCTVTSAPTPTPTASPSADLGPAILETGDAGRVYLAAICPANAAITANNKAFNQQSFKAILRTAVAAREASRDAAEYLDRYSDRWPEEIVDDVDDVFNSLSEVAYFDQVARASTLEQANVTTLPPDVTAEAAQRIRLRLGLPSNTSEGCADIGKIMV